MGRRHPDVRFSSNRVSKKRHLKTRLTTIEFLRCDEDSVVDRLLESLIDLVLTSFSLSESS